MDDIRGVGDALIADTAGNVDYFIDLHSTVSGKAGHFGLIHPDFQADPFWQNFLQLEPSVSTNNASLISLTAQKLGSAVGRAFAQTFRLFADLNFDNRLNEQDWQLLTAFAETDLSQLTPIGAYQAGDLDGDGENSIVDFGLFKDAYVAAHGLSSFEALLNPLPEPSAWALTLTALAGWPWRISEQ